MPPAYARKARQAADRKLKIFLFVMIPLGVLTSLSPWLVVAYFWPRSFPYVLGGVMIASAVGLLISHFRESRRQLRQIGATTEEIVPGRLIEARGIYVSGFEAGWIMVATGKKKLGIFPQFEKWSAIDRHGQLPPMGTRDSWAYYLLRFTGIPSEPGSFGHMGGCQRTVEIHEVIAVEAEAPRLKDLPMASALPV